MSHGLILDGKADITHISVPQWTGFISDALLGVNHSNEEEHHRHLPHRFTDSIMKTLCFTLGLLLLVACCCDAIRKRPLFVPQRTCLKASDRHVCTDFIHLPSSQLKLCSSTWHPSTAASTFTHTGYH